VGKDSPMARNGKKRLIRRFEWAAKRSGSGLPELARDSESGGDRETGPVVRRGCAGIPTELHLASA
jgi:hypothetical protein